MEKYLNHSGNSGITNYEIGSDFIEVIFSNSLNVYRYSYARAGEIHVENMKELALKGEGLNTYINRHVKNLFD